MTAGAPKSPAFIAASPSTIAPTTDRESPAKRGIREFASRRISKSRSTIIISSNGLNGMAPVALIMVIRNFAGSI